MSNYLCAEAADFPEAARLEASRACLAARRLASRAAGQVARPAATKEAGRSLQSSCLGQQITRTLGRKQHASRQQEFTERERDARQLLQPKKRQASSWRQFQVSRRRAFVSRRQVVPIHWEPCSAEWGELAPIRLVARSSIAAGNQSCNANITYHFPALFLSTPLTKLGVGASNDLEADASSPLLSSPPGLLGPLSSPLRPLRARRSTSLTGG